jgi:hypothetical protein
MQAQMSAHKITVGSLKDQADCERQAKLDALRAKLEKEKGLQEIYKYKL